jgi:hypothetical protein
MFARAKAMNELLKNIVFWAAVSGGGFAIYRYLQPPRPAPAPVQNVHDSWPELPKAPPLGKFWQADATAPSGTAADQAQPLPVSRIGQPAYPWTGQ